MEVIIGPGDDAGVYRMGGMTVIETVDVITPVVNDPFTFGAISANNSMSDVFAMGGRPVSALAVVGYSPCDYETEVLSGILQGAIQSLASSGAVLLGGHCFEDSELKFGLSVTGVLEQDKLLRVSGAAEGDLLLLTKPIGIGILSTALKGGKITDAEMEEAVSWMLTSNEEAARLAIKAHASACTDVTGFGLLGHALHMVKGSQTDFVIDSHKVPSLRRARVLIDAGMVPEGAYNNQKFVVGGVFFGQGVSDEMRLLLCDPQTSGGLLIAVPEANSGVFRGSSVFHEVIGRVVRGQGRIYVN